MDKTIFKLALCLIVLLCTTHTLVYSQSRSKSSHSKKAAKSDFTVVKARKGDTIKALAARTGVSATEIAQLNDLPVQARLRQGERIKIPAASKEDNTIQSTPVAEAEIIGNRIKLADGRTMEVDEAWKQGEVVWYRRGKVTESLEQAALSIEPIRAKKKVERGTDSASSVNVAPASVPQTWIYLVGGAKFKVDEVKETAEGAWYNRGNVSIFLERERISRIAHEDSSSTPTRYSDWTSGNARIDSLIRSNGARFGVDPYFIFCVIEHESHFHTNALSPKGARGLMQLMPGTAARFGVKRSFDAAENIRGGTQYLKELMDMFGGQVNLVLASYNAGEGAVMKYGRNVPPYKETREYVKKIGKRYGMSGRKPDDNDVPAPQR